MYGHFPPARFVLGKLGLRQPLIVRSYRPEGGVIFSDGIEADYVSFNAGAVATVSVAERKARLVARG